MHFIFTLLLLISFTKTLSQSIAKVTLYNIQNREIIQTISVKEKDSSNIQRTVGKVVDYYIEKGFPLSSVDSLHGNFKTGYKAFLFLGPKIKTLKINIADEDTKLIIKAVPAINEKFLSQLPFTNKDILLTKKRVLKYLEDNGHPFASMQFESLQLSEKPSVKMRISKGPLVKWKKIHIKGDLRLHKNYLLTLLEIKEGDTYSEEKFQKAATRLKQIPFITVSQAPQVAFFPDGAELYLYLTKRQASSANGILGMQPNTNGKISFTGDLQLRLENGIGFGEQLQLIWKNLMPQSPQLNVGVNIPFLFKTKFGTDAKFHLYKRDTAFLEVKGNFGLRYFLGKNNFVKGFYNFESSNILNGATGNPLFSDGVSVRISGYGLGFERQVLDYFPNPRQGFKLDFQTVFGSRKTFPIDENNLSRPGTQSNVYKGSLNIDYFIPFANRSTIRLGAQAQFYHADTIFSNEQIRFGGLQSMRGFNEESLLATTLSKFTLEYRFLLDQNSHLLLFFDQAIYENRSRNYIRDTPFGFGGGLSFGTKAGMFSIIYAIGRQFNNPLNIRDGKIHIGYFAMF